MYFYLFLQWSYCELHFRIRHLKIFTVKFSKIKSQFEDVRGRAI